MSSQLDLFKPAATTTKRKTDEPVTLCGYCHEPIDDDDPLGPMFGEHGRCLDKQLEEPDRRQKTFPVS